jgi:hypothetical protein
MPKLLLLIGISWIATSLLAAHIWIGAAEARNRLWRRARLEDPAISDDYLP